MAIESVQQHAYARGWLRPVALGISVSAHAAAVFWLVQPPAAKSVPASPPPAQVMYVTLPSEPASPPHHAPPRPAISPNPSRPPPPVKSIPIKPVEVGSAAGQKQAQPDTPFVDGLRPNAGLLAQIREPVAGAGGRDGTDALRNWCTTPATTPVGSTAQPAPAKPPRDPDADIVVVDCECLIAMVRPYQLTGEQMAMYLAFVDPRSTTERFLGLAATYRAKHGLAKTRRLMDTFDEMANKLDTCAA